MSKEDVNRRKTSDDPDIDRRMAELAAASVEIGEIMQNGTSRWVDLYSIVQDIEAKELYKPVYRSVTAWARALAKENGFALREFWRITKAGTMYTEYAARQAGKGRAVPALTEIRPGHQKHAPSISPRNFETVQKIAAGDEQLEDQLIGGMLAGTIKAKELNELWKTRKASGAQIRKTRHEAFEKPRPLTERELTESGGLTAADLVLAIQTNSGWLPDIPEKYRVFAEFPVPAGQTGPAGTIDALAVDMRGTSQIRLHAIRIKSRVSDLKEDKQIQRYADSADYLWIAVPDTPAMLRAAESRTDELENSIPSCGILAVTVPSSAEEPRANRAASPVRVVRPAPYCQGQMRGKTLESLICKLL